MKTLKTLVFIAVLLLAGVVGYAYSGLFDVAASSKDGPVLHWVLETTREQSIERRAEGIAVPDLSPPPRAANGARAFDDMCAGCHGAPGRQPFTGAQDMNPAPPDLAKVAGDESPAELFWVIKHGIRMTGMPAWGATHTDDELWDVVAFLRELPDLSPERYERLAAAGSGHSHSDDHGHEAGTEGQHSH